MRFPLLIIFFITAFPVFSQYTIKGVVLDSTSKEKLPFATVVLYLQSNDSIVNAVSTDLEGEFKIQGIKNGSYTLTIDFLGKDKLRVSPIVVKGESKNLGVLFLKSGVQLDEVVISAKKSSTELKIDRKTFNVSENQNVQGGSATDVLNNLPSVNVDQDGGISLRGNSNLRILIDGKPTGLNGENIAQVLKQIPANTIENIEIITVPSSKYDAESSGGIINIILKGNKKDGSYGNFNVNYGNWDKINTGLSWGVKKNKIAFDVTYGYRYGTYTMDRSSKSTSDLIDSLTLFTITGDGKNNNPSHFGKINLAYKLTSKSELSLSSNVNVGENLNKSTTNYEWLYHNSEKIERQRSAKTSGLNNNIINTLLFKRDLKSKGESISFSSNHAYTDNTNQGDFFENETVQTENGQLFSNEFNQNLDVVKMMKKNKIELGGQHTFRDIKNDFVFIGDTSLYNNFKYKDNISAGYLMFTGSVKSWTIAAGYRMEYTFSDSKNKTSGLNIQRSYFNHFPSFSLSKKFSETNELGLNYSRRINRPNFNQLNPAPSYSDPYSLRTGNPDLVPGINNIVELSWLKRLKFASLQSTLFYQKRTDRLRRIRFIDENGVSNVTWVNYKSEDYYGLELFSSFKIHRNVSSTLSLTLFERITDGTNIDPTFSARFYGLESKLNLTWKLPYDFNFQVSGEYISSDQTVIGIIFPRYFIDLGLNKKILKDKGKIGLRFADAFNIREFNIKTDAQNWQQEARFKHESQILFLNFTYDFGKRAEKENKDKKPVKKDSEEF